MTAWIPGTDADTSDRLAPLAVGVGLLAVGALLWRGQPGVLTLPDPVSLDDDPNPSRLRRYARKSRDGVAWIAPTNLSVSLGRSLVLAGASMLLTRLLDEIVSRGR